MKKKLVFIMLTCLGGLNLIACPPGQHEECILPRLGGGCAVRVCAPDVNIKPTVELDFCGKSLTVYTIFAPACTTAINSSIVACGAAISTAGSDIFTDAACGGSVAGAVLSCSVGIESVKGIVKNCLGLN